MSNQPQAASGIAKAIVVLPFILIAVIGWPVTVPLGFVALLVLAVRRLAFQSGDAGRSLRPWARPFLWIMLSPLVTVPASGLAFDFLVGTQSAGQAHLPDVNNGWFSGPTRYFELSPTVLIFTIPGIVNAAAFGWAFSNDRKVRAAAVVAGSLGLLRASLPAVVLLAGFHQLTNPAGMTFAQYDSTFHPAPYIDVWGAGVVAWVLSLLIWGLFEKGRPDVITPERLAWVAGAVALLAVVLGLGAAAYQWQAGDRVLHLQGYDIRESDWRVASRLWANDGRYRGSCEAVGELSARLATAAQLPGHPNGPGRSLAGEDWDAFFGRGTLTAVEGQTAWADDLQKAGTILLDECRKRSERGSDLL